MGSTLTAKQRAFCLEYLVDLSATQAAIRAGYSIRSAASIGEENLRKPEIRRFLDVAMNEREEKTKISAERVVQELAAIAFTRASDVLVLSNGQVEYKSVFPAHAQAAIQEIISEPTNHGPRARVRFHDKLRALELLLKHCKSQEASEVEKSAGPRERDRNELRVALGKMIDRIESPTS